MLDNLEWIANAWNARESYITCARGLDPQQLVERMADNQPVKIEPATTLQEASAMVDIHRVSCAGAGSNTRRSCWSQPATNGCDQRSRDRLQVDTKPTPGRR
ncbi:hypothetical protein [Streptomyces sp. PA5.6]|uniref:hypothetical protein n=1 Tax=Streptomyces sp. PA5.6 TaxID=3035651 RepID=UPI0039046493